MCQCWELCRQLNCEDLLGFLLVTILFCNGPWHWLQVLGRNLKNGTLKTIGADSYFFQCNIRVICGIQLISIGDKESGVLFSSALNSKTLSYEWERWYCSEQKWMSFREIISDKEILYTHIHTNTYCMRSLNPSPIFLAGVTDRTSMLHIFFL